MTPQELAERFAQDLKMAKQAKSISRSNNQLMHDLSQYSLDPMNYKLNHSIPESWIAMTYDIGLQTDILRVIKISESQNKVFKLYTDSSTHLVEQVFNQLPAKMNAFTKAIGDLKKRESFVYITNNQTKPVFEHLVWALDVLHRECLRLNNCY